MALNYALLLGIPAVLFVYIAFKLDDRHAVMRMFLITWGWIMLLPMPVIGMELAKEAGYSGIKQVMEISLIPLVFGFVFWVFYLILLYIRDSMDAAQNPGDEFSNEM